MTYNCIVPRLSIAKYTTIEIIMLEADKVKKQWKQFLEQEVIRPSTSPCEPPIIIGPKKDKTMRIFIDYKDYNKFTLKN